MKKESENWPQSFIFIMSWFVMYVALLLPYEEHNWILLIKISLFIVGLVLFTKSAMKMQEKKKQKILRDLRMKDLVSLYHVIQGELAYRALNPMPKTAKKKLAKKYD